MYLSYYGLQKKPFQISTDPSFLWLGDSHEEALAILKYGVLENQGFLLLTGDVGTGKTTLINALINSLGDEVIVAKVPDPGMEIMDFMNFISHAFDMKKKFVSKDAFLIHFSHFLNSAHTAGKKCLLIIDEAQRLSPALLEEVRQLSNIEKQEAKLLKIFLVGHIEFNDVLLESKNRPLQQRITINYVIEPLDVHETSEFVKHRLKISGAREDIFSPDAIRNVYEFSRGFPRRINIICDHALLSGFVQRTKTVTGEMVKECAEDLLLPEFSKNKKSESLESEDTADSEIVEDIPPEPIQRVRSGKGWKIVSTVVLLAMAIFIVILTMFPGEYRNFLSRLNNSGERGANAINANSNTEPDQKAVPGEAIDTHPEVTVAAEGVQEVSIAKEPSTNDLEADSPVSAIDRPETMKEAPVVPGRIDEASNTLENRNDVNATGNVESIQVDVPSTLEQKKTSNEEVTLKAPVTSETDAIEKMETGADLEKGDKAGVIEIQEKSALAFETPADTEKETGTNDIFQVQISGDNEEKVESVEGTSAVIFPVKKEDALYIISVNPVNVVGQDESKGVQEEILSESGKVEDLPDTNKTEQPAMTLEPVKTELVQPHPVNLQSQAHDRSSELADEAVKTTSMTDSPISGVSDETDRETVKPEKPVAEVPLKIEEDVAPAITNARLPEPATPPKAVEPVEPSQTDEVADKEPENMDPGALIDWVIKKRSSSSER